MTQDFPTKSWLPGLYNNLVLLMAVWKESLNSNCYEFHQYQPNEQSPLILNWLTSLTHTHTNTYNNNIMRLEIHLLAWDRHTNVAGIKRLIRSQPSPLDNSISGTTVAIHKNKIAISSHPCSFLSSVFSSYVHVYLKIRSIKD